MEPLASRDSRTLGRLEPMPAAATLPPGAVVLSLSGTDRSALRWGFVVWSLALFGGGVALGYYIGRRG